MDNKNIICSNCATENEEKYDYCKNCGTKLEKHFNATDNDSFRENEQSYANQNYSYDNQSAYYPKEEDYSNYQTQNSYSGNTYVETIAGIPYSEVSVFVGKKAPKYMNTFARMEITGAKTAWHWPTAILSLFMGPLGAALWFFYRKMYKIALILSVVGIIVTAASALIIGPVAASVDVVDIILNIAQPENLNAENLKELTLRSEIANFLTGIVSLICLLVCGLFTHGWYKNHIHNTILKYRSSNVDMRYYQLGLMSIGGTSGGMLALGIAIMFLSENITSIIFAVLSPL